MGRGFDNGCLNAFLAAALLHVVRDAVPIQAPASASVVPSAAVRGFDAGISCGLDSGGQLLVESAKSCSQLCRYLRGFSVAAARSSVGGADVCQVMNPGPSCVVQSSLVEGATVSSNRP